MPGPRLSPWLLLGAVALGATASERAVAPSPDAAEAERVFCGLVLARNSNDFARASALMADDMRWFDSEGSAHSKNERRLETMLAWEHASSARWSCRVVGFADGWLEAEVSESNRLYDALDVGTIFQRNRIRIENGRVREGRTIAEWSAGRDYDEANDEF